MTPTLVGDVKNSAAEGLPAKFVLSMRTLFDILDDKRTGYVKFSEIETRWQDDGTKGLPKGVLDSLRKVTPPNGLLSFDRFCTGLKMCLLRNQMENGRRDNDSVRPPSAPLLDIDIKPNVQWTNGNMAAIRPTQQRTLSMPQLALERNSKEVHQLPQKSTSSSLFGPPKPPRTAAGLERGLQLASGERIIDKAEIRTALQNWQLGVLLNDQSSSRSEKQSGEQTYKRINQRRREPRRHTLQSGVDYNMLKRIKQIEQEKEVLMHGLQAVERARDWYHKQISAVQEKMKYLGRTNSHTQDQWTEAQQERIELQRARVLEVNRHLSALTDGGERWGGLPLHMNLAVHSSNNPGTMLHQNPQVMATLKHRNHILTEELGQKSERISTLEREKATLIRELFQTRTQMGRKLGRLDSKPDGQSYIP
ncbi:suppressor APC domain-containing protein 2 isoform X1 [Acyrthosiphon pisum]|uniref:Suppressor APC domain-containing protein n=1 Tax=Acyrthosiphon pisum TaxID=7029 RepID=A0A8R2F975_ACYPI|nr:suppressor APC domain-containing protein 2 isoform X1 [Acyrthosiphon pisum]XP_029344325.1 suppressor APC domain-containing protein 2 isoform X1 [Acyrthosiphon pisum]|eukprot:XP_008182222.1 PREDICTED: suppressor APC domain-containing protein 2 isoform X1 [Acyrthosiphon pisum]